jgi:hypothetical protein
MRLPCWHLRQQLHYLRRLDALLFSRTVRAVHLVRQLHRRQDLQLIVSHMRVPERHQ